MPLEKRMGSIPEGIQQEIEDASRRAEENPNKKRRLISATKNATPGDAEQEVKNCLDDVRPRAFTLDLKPSDCTAPDAVRRGALERYGQLDIQTGNQIQS